MARRKSREDEKIPQKLPAVKAKFKKGNKVYKTKTIHGYTFLGTVRSAFTIESGEWRYAVEIDSSAGLIHIFSGNQIKAIEK